MDVGCVSGLTAEETRRQAFHIKHTIAGAYTRVPSIGHPWLQPTSLRWELPSLNLHPGAPVHSLPVLAPGGCCSCAQAPVQRMCPSASAAASCAAAAGAPQHQQVQDAWPGLQHCSCNRAWLHHGWRVACCCCCGRCRCLCACGALPAGALVNRQGSSCWVGPAAAAGGGWHTVWLLGLRHMGLLVVGRVHEGWQCACTARASLLLVG